MNAEANIQLLVSAVEAAAERIAETRLATVTVEQLAQDWHRNPETIRRWIKSGALAASNLGGTYLVLVRDAAAFFQKRRVKA